MARVLLPISIPDGSTIAAGNTRYMTFGQGGLQLVSSGEAGIARPVPKGGIVSNLHVYVPTNPSTTGNLVVRLRQNSANTSLAVTIPAGATGLFTDDTDTVTVADEDTLAIQVVNGGDAAPTLTLISVVFDNQDDVVAQTYINSQLSINVASTTQYFALATSPGGNATEKRAKSVVGCPGDFTNARILIQTNGRTTSSTLKSRLNGADGAFSMSIPGGSTGTFADDTFSDSVVAGDTYNWSLQTGTGTGTLTIRSVLVMFTSDDRKAPVFTNLVTGLSAAAGTTKYTAAGGVFSEAAAEANVRNPIGFTADVSKLAIFLVSNGVTSSSTARVRKEGANSTIVATLTASTPGLYTDLVHTERFAASDDLNLSLVAGAGGTSFLTTSISIVIEDMVTPVTKTKGLIYKIKKPIGKTKGLIYKVKRPNQKNKTLAYKVKITPAPKNKALVYKVKKPIIKQKTLVYRVKAAVLKTKGLIYRVVTHAQTQKAMAYAVKAPVTKQKSLTYRVTVEQAAITKDLTYTVTTPAAIQKDLAYQVVVPVTKNKDLQYFVTTQGAQNKDLSYQITRPVTVQKSLTYSVTIPGGITKDLSYSVVVETPVQKTLAYAVKRPVSASKSLQYTIELTHGLNKSLSYAVVLEQAPTKSLAYLVITHGLQQKVLTYQVGTVDQIVKGLQYAVEAPISLSKGLAYRVTTQGLEQKTLAYIVAVPHSLTKSLQYVVDAPHVIQKSLKYTVYAGERRITKGLTYAISGFPYHKKGPIYSAADKPYSKAGSPFTPASKPYERRVSPYQGLPR